jgi:hypothetical protein
MITIFFNAVIFALLWVVHPGSTMRKAAEMPRSSLRWSGGW